MRLRGLHIEGQRRPGADAASVRLSSCKFKHGTSSFHAGRTPWRQVRHDLEDAVIGIEKHDVDRKAHEEGVDGTRGAKEDSFAPRKIRATEQAAHAGHGMSSDVAALTHDTIVDPNGGLTEAHL